MRRPVYEVETLGLSTRAVNILLRNDYLTKADLAGITAERLLSLKNCGITTVNEILTAIGGENAKV